jgi:hypothetical protein
MKSLNQGQIQIFAKRDIRRFHLIYDFVVLLEHPRELKELMLPKRQILGLA